MTTVLILGVLALIWFGVRSPRREAGGGRRKAGGTHHAGLKGKAGRLRISMLLRPLASVHKASRIS